MPYQATLQLRSGDRAALDATVDDLVAIATGKGAEVAGPHPKPTKTVRVPLYTSHAGEKLLRMWEYTVYTRHLEITGHEAVAKRLAQQSIPSQVAISMTIDHIGHLGSTN